MRRLALALGALLPLACAKADAPPVADAAAAAPTIHLADLAGAWSAVATTVGSDSVLVTFDMAASADPMNWSMTLPGREPVAMTVGVSGDSILTQSEPYESALRPGIQVTVNGSMHLVDGALVGPSIAHYATTGPDSVVHLWITATRSAE